MDGKKWILYVKDGSEQERVVPLSSARPVTIGRSRSSGLQLRAPGVSRNHALLEWRHDHPVLTDCGSLNGTRVGNERVSAPRQLRSGDTIHLAEAILRIVALDDSNPHTAILPAVAMSTGRTETRGAEDTAPTRAIIHASSTVTPWRHRSKAAILSAGALAAAVLGVVNLWDRFFPQPRPADEAEIDLVLVIEQMTLADFAKEGLRRDLSLGPVSIPGDNRADFGTNALAGVRGSTTRPTRVMPAPSRLATPRITRSIAPSATPTRPSPFPTDRTSPPGQPRLPDQGFSTNPGTTTPVPESLNEGFILKVKTEIPEGFTDAVCEQEELKDLEQTACDAALGFTLQSVDDEGVLVPPPQAATALAEALAEVEMLESERGLDPLGSTFSLRLGLEGFASEPMLLTWSLDGPEVPEAWQTENLACRVMTVEAHGAGMAQVWIPDLERPGTYNVNLRLSSASDGRVADARQFQITND
jgi:FHA domain